MFTHNSSVGKTRVVSLVLVLGLVMGALSLLGCGGDGEDPFADFIHINNLDDFVKIGSDAATYPLDGEYVLSADITLTDWTPIGSDTAPFTGILQGNNKTITLSSFSGADAARYLGVFAYVNGAELNDVKIAYSASAITGTVEIDTYIGAAAAYAKSTKFTDITVSGTLDLTNVGTTANVAVYGGGIAGYVEDAEFTRCISSAVVTLTGNSNTSAGGIAGGADSSTALKTKFISCSSIGNITANWQTGGTGNYGQIYAGGIIGNSRVDFSSSGSLFEECYTTGSVTGSSNNNPYVGGIAGNFHGAGVIKSCYTTGAISATTGSSGTYDNSYVGGIAGNNSGSSTIENSYSTGDINLTGKGFVGGITGQNGSYDSIVRYCYARGTVTSDTATASVGGIVGQSYASEDNDVNANAALNSAITAVATTTKAHRVVGESQAGAKVTNNIAYSSMTIEGFAATDTVAGGLDGADTTATPAWSVYSGLGWSPTVWKTTLVDGYPALVWE